MAAAGVVLAMLPDADIIGFELAIPYASDWGHRGASHSLMIAVVCAGRVTPLLRTARTASTFMFLFVAMASHGLLDMVTDGGRGPALWWPWSSERVFAPMRPIRVSPIASPPFSVRAA